MRDAQKVEAILEIARGAHKSSPEQEGTLLTILRFAKTIEHKPTYHAVLHEAAEILEVSRAGDSLSERAHGFGVGKRSPRGNRSERVE